MDISFLRHLPVLSELVVREVVLATGGEKAGASTALQHLLDELPDLLMAAVVDVATGKSLANYAAERHLWPGKIAGPYAALLRHTQAGLAAQNLSAERVEEVMITLPSQLHLLRLTPVGSHFLYLAVDIRDTNLGIAREIMRQGIDRLTL